MFCLFLFIELLVELHYVQVKLVGMVRNRAGRITDVTFALDDGTGRIDCSKWFVSPHQHIHPYLYKMEKKLDAYLVDIDFVFCAYRVNEAADSNEVEGIL